MKLLLFISRINFINKKNIPKVFKLSKIYSDRPSIASKQQLEGTRLFHAGNA